MGVVAEKVRAVRAAIGMLEKQFGKGAVMSLEEGGADPVATIPTGSLSLDHALGCGGYPRGRIVEVYGHESSGKTTLALHAIAEVQKAGGVAAFVDAEHALDVNYAKSIGVDLTGLLVSQPDNGEQALEICDALVRSGAVDLIVVDSVAALVPQAELEGDMGEAHLGLHARLMSQALRKLTALAHKHQVTILFINQVRMKIGVMFGSPETTTGGHALKFYASVRLEVRRLAPIKVGEEAQGNRTRVKVVKNKMAAPFREVEFDVRYGSGIDSVSELLELGAFLEVVDKSGSHLSFGGQHLGNGRERARETLLADAALRARLGEALRAAAIARRGQAPAAAQPALGDAE